MLKNYWGLFEIITDKNISQILTAREYKIIEQRYFEGKNYEETGREFGVNGERVRQIETKALEKLKSSYEDRKGLEILIGMQSYINKKMKELI